MQLDVDDTNDKVLVEVWLPLVTDDWNGRLQATGGLRFTTGMLGAQLGVGVKSGWAAVSTDGGHDVSPWGIGDASWALKKDRTVNWNLLQNFASRSIVEQVPIGKRIVEQYYGVKPHHSYWNGCSTGGRQGYAIAQKYPHLVDAILANAPALSFGNLIDSEGELVTRELCAWPAKPKYTGVGSAKRASSWSCVGGPERLFTADEAPTPGRLQEVLSGIRSRMGGLGLGLSIE